MQVNFFRRDVAGGPEQLPLSADLQLRFWQPELDGFPPRGAREISNQFWWALASVAGFARKGFAEIRIEKSGRLLHRLIVTPRWYRFPFMGEHDLQIGAVWTAPEARRKQLARIAIAEAHHRLGSDGTRFWYVADATNAASQALARSCGYRLVATGRRTRRLGTRLLGQYVIDRFV